jgi:broad specificity phosphatase PhoE
MAKDSGIPNQITYTDGYIPRILCVTHGGLIMEFLNYADSFLGTPPVEGSRQNKAKNCGIFVFRFHETDDKLGFRIETVVENDVDHLNQGGGAEDRGIGNA